MTPNPDDLLSLLSIFRDCTDSRHLQNPTSQEDTPTPHNKSSHDANDWEHIVTALPQHRNRLLRDMFATVNFVEKFHSSQINRHDIHDRDTFHVDASILQQVEISARNLRNGIQSYSSAIPGFRQTLSRFWNFDNAGQVTKSRDGSVTSNEGIARVGNLLATQLINQMEWDDGMMSAVLEFLDYELYGNNDGRGKMRIFADATSAMLQVDKSLWKLVERQVLNELNVIEEKGDDRSNYLNKLGSSLESCLLLPVPGDASDENNNSSHGGPLCTSLHELLVSSESVDDAVHTFTTGFSSHPINSDEASTSLLYGHPSITSILVTGEAGCGKTFLLNNIEKHIRDRSRSHTQAPDVRVIRLTKQDFVGNTVGSSEDRWISLFSYAAAKMQKGMRVLILLDDIDAILSLDELGGFSSTTFHVGRRCKALLLSILDSLKGTSFKGSGKNGHLMLVCTARSQCDEITGRFDRIFIMSAMNERQRRHMIITCLSSGVFTDDSDLMPALRDDKINEFLSLIVKHSTGRTAFELSQCLRDVILAEATTKSDDKEFSNNRYSLFENRLRKLDKMMQSRAPQSLRGGSLDGIVDMIVCTPDELASKLTVDERGEVTLPLLGTEARRAYESLMDVVITPLCRLDKITSLLYGGLPDPGSGPSHGHPPRHIRVGALLAGGPGVGKTSLAYHCASVAAQMSRVSLLDVSCTSLIHKEIGGSERAVRRLFDAVRAAAPCILLLDGIENVAPRRGNDCTTEGTMDRVLSTFLTEMDGVNDDCDDASGNVAVIGITYNPDLIDPSLLRPGRLAKTILLGPPDFEARKELVFQHIQHLDFDFSSAGYFDPKSKRDIAQFVAMESAGMTAVETLSICKEASMECLREINFDLKTSKLPQLTYGHFRAAAKIMRGNAK